MINKRKYLLWATFLLFIAVISYRFFSSPPKTHTLENTKRTVILLEDNVNIRTDASENSAILSKGMKGDTFPFIQQEKDWYQIILPNKETAYITSSLGAISYEKTNKILEGKSIVLDAGHGGKDDGAIGKNGTVEKDLTLQTVKNIQQELLKLGATVILTREDDTYIELEDRVSISQKQWADLFISIHYDSALTSAAKGITTFYYQNNKDKPLAEAIHESLIKKTKATNRGYLYGDYQVLRINKIPSILLELGFLTNEEDERRINTEIFQQTAVEAIVDGIIEYVHE
jgi:N-acetylmuramoyl-L-alanine amidase